MQAPVLEAIVQYRHSRTQLLRAACTTRTLAIDNDRNVRRPAAMQLGLVAAVAAVQDGGSFTPRDEAVRQKM